MNKKWLIRTQHNHLAGPLSKDEVVLLINNGTLAENDEICSGNGFWLFIREAELIELYLYGEKQQVFNPITETYPVLTEEQFTPLVIKNTKIISKTKNEEGKTIHIDPKILEKTNKMFDYVTDPKLKKEFILNFIENNKKKQN